MSTILQDKWGWFWRDEGDGNVMSLSDDQGPVPRSTIASPVVLIQDGEPTGLGDALATRVALHCVRTGVW